MFVGIFVVEPLFDRTEPYQRIEGRIVAPNGGIPKRGTEVEVEYSTKVIRRCPGKATRHVIDGNGMDHDYKPHPATIVGLPKDEPTYSITFVLPSTNDKSVEKDWEYYSDLEYYCNWTQWYIFPIRSKTPTIKFRVQ